MRPVTTPVNILVAGGSGLGKSSFIRTFAKALGVASSHAEDSHTWTEPKSDIFEAGRVSKAVKSFQEDPEAWCTRLEPIEDLKAGRTLVYTFQVRTSCHTSHLMATPHTWTLLPAGQLGIYY